jgi:hypothetical protein
MSFSNIEMIHLYIYFKQENAKKNLYFFCVPLSGSHVHIGKKQYPRMFLGTILLKGCHQETKIFVSCIGFQSVDTLVNIAFDRSFKLCLIRKHSPATGGHQTKVNTLNKSLLEQKIKRKRLINIAIRLLVTF